MTGHLNARDDKRYQRSQRAQSGHQYGERATFINRELSQDERLAMLEWREDLQAVNAAWSEALKNGYKINTKYDDYNSCFAAYIIPPDDGPNGGFILAGRGGNALRAVSEGLFKHSVLFGERWVVGPAGSRGEADPDF
jgi:hypothetical protein